MKRAHPFEPLVLVAFARTIFQGPLEALRHCESRHACCATLRIGMLEKWRLSCSTFCPFGFPSTDISVNREMRVVAMGVRRTAPQQMTHVLLQQQHRGGKVCFRTTHKLQDRVTYYEAVEAISAQCRGTAFERAVTPRR